MKLRGVVPGAGFGGLELSTIQTEALGDRLDLTLIDKNDSFVFGYSKFDVMSGSMSPDAVRIAGELRVARDTGRRIWPWLSI